MFGMWWFQQSFTTPFSASASPTTAYGARATVGTATSSNVTCTPTGGTAPYTYLWEFVSGDASVVPTTSTSATTAFSALVGPSNPTRIATYRCKVTATGGAVVYTGNVTATLEYVI